MRYAGLLSSSFAQTYRAFLKFRDRSLANPSGMKEIVVYIGLGYPLFGIKWWVAKRGGLNDA